MATETIDKTHTDHHAENESWEGAAYPFRVGYGKLMIWYFLLSDAFTFAGFLIAYGTLRFSMPSWPVPDFVFSTFPFLTGQHPLLFVTLMTFVLLFSSFTMIRGVQEGQRENRRGVVIWMFLTILGGAAFLGCQAWEWSTLIGKEHMTVTRNPFGTHTTAGIYLDAEGNESDETFEAGASYLIHRIDLNAAHDDGHGDTGHGDSHGSTANLASMVSTGQEHADAAHADAAQDNAADTTMQSADGGDAHAGESHSAEAHADEAHTEDTHATDEHAAADHGDGGHHAHHYPGPGDYPDAVVDEKGFIHRKFIVSTGEEAGAIKTEQFGPKAFGALFFFITGFHGFHVFSGVIFLTIIMINVMSGLYVARRNKNEMVEKIGLYWHFVDLVWVFVFLVFYLL